MYDIRLRTLAYLASVQKTGHFGDAAIDMGVTQPALSQGLARLEASLGVDLFVADGRARVLTPAGRRVAEFASTVLGDAARLEIELLARSNATGGALRVGMIDAAALYLVSDAVQRFRDERPDVELLVAVEPSDTLIDAIAENRLDVALVVGPVSDPTASPVVAESLGIYGPPTSDLSSAQPWVLYPDGSHTRALVDAALRDLGVRPIVHAQSENPSVLAQLVRLGAGWTVLPPGIAESGPTPLTRVGDFIAQRQIVAVTSIEARNDPLALAFIETL